MSNDEERVSVQKAYRSRMGGLSAILGLITLASAVMVGVISFTVFNPPDWARFGVFALFGVGFLGSLFLGALGLRNPRRAWAIVGLATLARPFRYSRFG